MPCWAQIPIPIHSFIERLPYFLPLPQSSSANNLRPTSAYVVDLRLIHCTTTTTSHIPAEWQIVVERLKPLRPRRILCVEWSTRDTGA